MCLRFTCTGPCFALYAVAVSGSMPPGSMPPCTDGPASHDAFALQSVFIDFCSAGKVLTGDDDVICARLAEILKAHLRQQMFELLSQSQGKPVLFSYSSDATSLLCHTQASTYLFGKPVVRKGKVLHELLLQRGFMKSLSSTGRERVALLFADPLPLSAGKRQ